MAKEKRERVTADITDIKQQILEYAEVSGELTEEAWEMLTDAQKLVYLAKRQLNRVRGTKGPKTEDE